MNSDKTITISGPPGSGTSTVALLLRDSLQYEYINTGMIFRQMAEEYHMKLEAFGDFVAHHPDIDHELDRRQVEMAKIKHRVIEGRLAGHMTAREKVDTYRVYIFASEDIRAQRAANRDGQSFQEALNKIQERALGERQRYLSAYNIDIQDLSVYDVVIDSSNIAPQEIHEKIIEGYRGQQT